MMYWSAVYKPLKEFKCSLLDCVDVFMIILTIHPRRDEVQPLNTETPPDPLLPEEDERRSKNNDSALERKKTEEKNIKLGRGTGEPPPQLLPNRATSGGPASELLCSRPEVLPSSVDCGNVPSGEGYDKF